MLPPPSPPIAIPTRNSPNPIQLPPPTPPGLRGDWLGSILASQCLCDRGDTHHDQEEGYQIAQRTLLILLVGLLSFLQISYETSNYLVYKLTTVRSYAYIYQSIERVHVVSSHGQHYLFRSWLGRCY